uniref:Uncharacterized protein n=1 Tax=viral metagenome TaxID=1070528 RepID=A0A6C0D7B4_9ZZZZ
MSMTFSNQVFKKSSNIKNSSDYLQNKKANLLLNNLMNNLNTDIENKKFGNQSNYLLIEKAIITNNIDKSNKNDILSDLYSHVHLGSSMNDDDSNLQDNDDDFNDENDDGFFYNNNNINPIVSNSNSNITTIDNKTIYPNKKNVPFYYKYRIDPNGNLFGNTPSENNYNKFRFITK